MKLPILIRINAKIWSVPPYNRPLLMFMLDYFTHAKAHPLNYLPTGPCQGISDTVSAAEANKNIVYV